MELKSIKTIKKPVDAAVSVPGSKSITNRALLIASLAKGKTRLNNALFSDDSRYFAGALTQLGFEVEMDEPNKTISVVGLGGVIPAKNADLFIGNAGTAARFLSAFLTIGHGTYHLDGEPRMRERPIGDLVDALKKIGVEINGTLNAESLQICPPVTINAKGLDGGNTQISGEISSQYLSALMMVAPYASQTFVLDVVNELNSKPYVDMTARVMADFGVKLERDEYRQFIIRKGEYNAKDSYTIESDASAASYFFALPALCGGHVIVKNIQKNSIQGDIQFLDVLENIGLTVKELNDSIEVSFDRNKSILCGVDINMAHIPDTAQTLAVIAPFATTPTTIRGIASARMKETDRVSATCNELRTLGVMVEEFEDGMKIYPCNDLRPATIKTYKDHRMAMAFSLIGTRVDGVIIEDPACVSKTFPNFFDVLEEISK
jgi:3-phosphoshikimate 1-carboxyvinyltransferase